MTRFDTRTKQMEIAASASESGLHSMLDGLSEAFAESEDRAEQASIRAQYEAVLAIARFRFENFIDNWGLVA